MAICLHEEDGGVISVGQREGIRLQPESQFPFILCSNGHAFPWSIIFGQVWSMDSHHGHNEF